MATTTAIVLEEINTHRKMILFRVLSSAASCFLIAGEDYTSVQKNLTFAVGLGTVECVYIPILNDLCLEDANETFSVSVSSNTDCVVIDPSASEVEITITDNDGKMFLPFVLYRSHIKVP